MDSRETLARQAAYVRELYCLARRRHDAKRGKMSDFGAKEMPRWDGGLDEDSGREYRPVWPQVVKFCVENKLEPGTLVRAVFDNHQSPHPPTPTSLTNQNALGLYKKHAIAERLLLRQELDYNRNQAHKYFVSFTVRKNAEPPQAWREVVLSDPPMLSPLYRYCLAVKGGFDDVAALYKDEAMHDYLWAKDAYDAEWSEWIPAPLREEAEDKLAGLRSVLATLPKETDNGK